MNSLINRPTVASSVASSVAHQWQNCRPTVALWHRWHETRGLVGTIRQSIILSTDNAQRQTHLFHIITQVLLLNNHKSISLCFNQITMVSTKLLIFVCVSNTCRSPMAEYLMRNKLETANLGEAYRVISRSLTTAYEPEDSPASYQGVEVRSHILYGCRSLCLLVKQY